MSTKTIKLMCDFETTTTPDDVRVWAVCAVDIETTETVFIDNNIHSFFKYLENKNTVCYFHNLKFDGEFILHYLLTHGYKYNNTHNPKTFETLITDDGVFYSITVYFAKLNKRYKKVVFYDSLKKLPFKVSVISKAFELQDEKLEIDYKVYRSVNHQLTEEEKQYIVNDCRIVAQALNIQMKQGLTKMTNASDAMNGYKTIITKKQFERLFPVLPVALDADIRRAYKGGYVYLNPKYKGKQIKNGITFDVNSLYPSVMYQCLLPYGYPMFFEGEYVQDETYPLFIVRLRCEFEIKKNHLPTIQLKNNRAFIETEYLTSSNGEIVEMTLTNVDLALFLEHYDVYNLEYECGWKFKGGVGMFKEYIDYWSHIKETSTGALRQLAKLMLNSLYGKFATNPNARKKIPVLVDDVVRYELDDPEEREPVYTAMGCFITAYAREKTIRTGQSVYDRYIYSDTDSLHLTGDTIPTIDVHPTKLGCWKHEGTFVDSKFIRAKTYMETMKHYKDNTLKNYCQLLNNSFEVWREGEKILYLITEVKCAGMPDNVKQSVTYDNFHSGSTFTGKLMPKRYKGGIILQETDFTIK